MVRTKPTHVIGSSVGSGGYERGSNPTKKEVASQASRSIQYIKIFILYKLLFRFEWVERSCLYESYILYFIIDITMNIYLV